MFFSIPPQEIQIIWEADATVPTNPQRGADDRPNNQERASHPSNKRAWASQQANKEERTTHKQTRRTEPPPNKQEGTNQPTEKCKPPTWWTRGSAKQTKDQPSNREEQITKPTSKKKRTANQTTRNGHPTNKEEQTKPPAKHATCTRAHTTHTHTHERKLHSMREWNILNIAWWIIESCA